MHDNLVEKEMGLPARRAEEALEDIGLGNKDTLTSSSRQHDPFPAFNEHLRHPLPDGRGRDPMIRDPWKVACMGRRKVMLQAQARRLLEVGSCLER